MHGWLKHVLSQRVCGKSEPSSPGQDTVMSNVYHNAIYTRSSRHDCITHPNKYPTAVPLPRPTPSLLPPSRSPPHLTPHLLIRHRPTHTITTHLRQLTLRTRSKHPPPPPLGQIRQILHDPLQILPHQLARRLREQKINLLQRLIFRLRHKQQLIKPSQNRNPTIKAQRESDARHGGLHIRKEIRHEPRAEKERHIRRFHTVTAQIGRVDFGRQHPGKAGIGAEEAFVDDETGDVDAFGRAGVFGRVDEVGAADDEEADEEAGEHGAGPEAPAEALHVEDCGDGAEEEGAAADEGHEDGLFAVEADLVH